MDEHLAGMPGDVRALLAPAIAPGAPDPWVRDALRAYLRYFTRLFELDDPPDRAEPELSRELADIAGTPSESDPDATIERAEGVLAEGFGDRGHRFLGGRTPPHYGAYVWRRTESRAFTVTLPRDEPQEVAVHFMHEFLIRGWLHWRTYGRQGAGGWYQDGDPAWEDGLYCVADRYPEPLGQNRAFQVSLLGHEAQHVADHRSYPGMTSVELEYRAKLVELIGYASVDDRLSFFLADASDDPTQPHPYAAHLIVERLSERFFSGPVDEGAWRQLSYEEIRRHAGELLDEDTASRDRR